MTKQDDAEQDEHLNYFSTIEDLFIRRRKSGNLFLRPEDWFLIEKWHSKNVPLEVITATINKIFDRYPNKPINSLTYFQRAVEAAVLKFNQMSEGLEITNDDLLEPPKPSFFPGLNAKGGAFLMRISIKTEQIIEDDILEYRGHFYQVVFTEIEEGTKSFNRVAVVRVEN